MDFARQGACKCGAPTCHGAPSLFCAAASGLVNVSSAWPQEANSLEGKAPARRHQARRAVAIRDSWPSSLRDGVWADEGPHMHRSRASKRMQGRSGRPWRGRRVAFREAVARWPARACLRCTSPSTSVRRARSCCRDGATSPPQRLRNNRHRKGQIKTRRRGSRRRNTWGVCPPERPRKPERPEREWFETCWNWTTTGLSACA